MREDLVGSRSGRAGRTRPAVAGLVALAVAASSLLSSGCEGGYSALGPEESVPTAPAASLPELHEDDFAEISLDGLLTFTSVDLLSKRSTRKCIKASKGGSVELNGFRVDIPAGALKRDTCITIELPDLPQAASVMADFGPSGTKFRKPVTITLPLEGVDLTGVSVSDVYVGYWNGSAWEDYGGTATSSSVKTKTTHFSAYGARTRSGGVDTTSGG